MRWQGGRESDNIEDRRGSPIGGRLVGGGLGTVALVVIALLFGVDPSTILNSVSGQDTVGPATESTRAGARGPVQESAADANLRKFVSVVLAETEDSWSGVFYGMGQQYRRPTLVLFSGAVASGCGAAESASGPFYCPRDQKIYLDLDFLRELSGRFGAPGDFARAYVIAHEVGHHVQNQLGLMDRVEQAGPRGASGASGASVRTELQADCLAGMWARTTDEAQHILEAGDIDSALAAASAVGDDRLQRASTGRVVPDSFKHGTSAQRVRWFRRGYDRGAIEACDTFSAEAL